MSRQSSTATPARKRKLLVLGCGSEQVAALQAARELGYSTVAFDNDPNAAGRAFADAFFALDLKNPHALLGQAEFVSPDGVFVHAAELAVEAACVAETLELPGLSVDSARLATEKQLRIECLAKAGLSTPRFEVLESEASLASWQEVAAEIGFPCVIKPNNQAGARGVERIESPDALEAYYTTRRAAFSATHFVCEELLEGMQLSTESVRASGKLLHNAIALRHYDTTSRYAPCFIEDGHSFPCALPTKQRAEVESVIEQSFDALGIETGVLKGDLLVTSEGEVVVLEMAARTSGGRFADTVVPISSGVDILYPLIELAMGDFPSRDWFTPTREVGVSQRFFLHAGAAKVERWPRFREILSSPWVNAWHLDYARLASHVLPDIRSHRDRLGYVICSGATREEADRRALELTGRFTSELMTRSAAAGGRR